MTDTPKRKNTYRDSPFGISIHPHLNDPDTKFNAAGVFKTGLAVSGPQAQAFKDLVDADADAAFEEATRDLTPGERKKWTRYVPYEVQEDDAGNPTGVIVFDFKQNATIKLRDGTEKKVEIGIYDATGKNPVRKPVWGGSEIRVNYSTRAIVVKSSRSAGVRLDFGRVQVRKLNTAGGGGGFGSVDDADAYVEDTSEGFSEATRASTAGPASADY